MHPRVIVVDDEPDSRQAVCQFVSLAELPVLPAASVSDARALLPVFVPDVIVSDLIMPKESGFDLARELRRWRGSRGQRIGAIAMSALSAPGIRQLALAAGFHAYLVKPCEPTNLVDAVQAVYAACVAATRR